MLPGRENHMISWGWPKSASSGLDICLHQLLISELASPRLEVHPCYCTGSCTTPWHILLPPLMMFRLIQHCGVLSMSISNLAPLLYPRVAIAGWKPVLATLGLDFSLAQKPLCHHKQLQSSHKLIRSFNCHTIRGNTRSDCII